jgi:UDP-perosamine 4-acetyltransferase
VTPAAQCDTQPGHTQPGHTQPGHTLLGRRLLIIGAGGHAKVLIEAVRAAGGEVAGLIAPAPSGTCILGVPVLGDDDALERLRGEGLGETALGVGDNRARLILAARLAALGFVLPAIVHPAAYLSASAVLGPGAVVLQRAAVGTEVVVGHAAIVNSGAIVEHDGWLDEAAHVAPGCALAGRVRVGARTLVGVGSAVRPGVVIGADAIVGAGSAVVADVADGAVVAGCPARPLANTPAAR